MLKNNIDQLKALGADITTPEIIQQPRKWVETSEIFDKKEKEIKKFLNNIKNTATGRVRVIFTGAGTSQYVGDTLVPYLNRKGDTSSYIFESIGTTDIVASPQDYLLENETTVLVSFGRSGNSPESMAAVELTDKYVKNSYHIAVTCAEEGGLAKSVNGRANGLLLLTPDKTNDGGFAMTSSFTCMLLYTLLIFDETEAAEKKKYVAAAAAAGTEILEREEEIAEFLKGDFERVIYLGSGSLSGLTREAQLKVLELTAGKVATVFDSSMGFRHGPKSFVNDKTLLFLFMNNDPKVRRYDVDMLNEVAEDDIALCVAGIGQEVEGAVTFEGTKFVFGEKEILPEAYLALPDIMVAQIISLLSSVKIGNTPDTPSATGTVNRVVKGVKIHEDK